MEKSLKHDRVCFFWILTIIKTSLFSTRKGNISLYVAIVGVAIGVFSLTTIVGIMNGMQSLLIDNLVLVETYDYKGTYTFDEEKTIQDVTHELETIDGVHLATAFIDEFALVQSKTTSSAIHLRAIDTYGFIRDMKLADAMLLLSSKDFQSIFKHPNTILLGWALANTLGVNTGDYLVLTFPGEGSGFTPVRMEVKVSNRFYIGNQYDETWAFIALNTYQNMTNTPLRTVSFGIRANTSQVRTKIQTVLSDVQAWQESNQAFYVALKTEKIILILLLIVIFAVILLHFRFSMIRRIHKKRDSIVSLRTTGASPHEIQYWFLGETMIIGIIGVVLGIVGATIFLEFYPTVSNWITTNFNLQINISQALYSKISIREVSAIIVFTFSIILWTSWRVVCKVSDIMPMQVIRYE